MVPDIACEVTWHLFSLWISPRTWSSLLFILINLGIAIIRLCSLRNTKYQKSLFAYLFMVANSLDNSYGCDLVLFFLGAGRRNSPCLWHTVVLLAREKSVTVYRHIVKTSTCNLKFVTSYWPELSHLAKLHTGVPQRNTTRHMVAGAVVMLSDWELQYHLPYPNVLYWVMLW